MGCDATYDEQLAPAPHSSAEVGVQHAHPKPEHTGAGFPQQGPLEALSLHLRSGRWLRYAVEAPVKSVARTSYDQDDSAGVGAALIPRALSHEAGARLYRVRKLSGAGEFATVTQALAQWSADKSTGRLRAAVIEIADSATYHEAPAFRLDPGEYLQLRAASHASPVLRMFDYHIGEPERVVITGGAGSRFVLDGVQVAGGSIEVGGEAAAVEAAPLHVVLLNCTLVPGWDPDYTGREIWRIPPSISLRSCAVALRIEHCILGPLHVPPVPAGAVSATLELDNSILDGGHEAGLAIEDGACGAAMLKARFRHCLVVGLIQLEHVELAENSVFLGPVLVAHRTEGSMHCCYVTPGSRTPRRILCQPELAQYAPGVHAEREAARVRPRYASLRYEAPGYCQLAADCAAEIGTGADDGTALGPLYRQSGLLPLPARSAVRQGAQAGMSSAAR